MTSPPRIDFEIALEDGALVGTRAGAGPALVLLHGWTLDRRMWAPQLDAFAGDHLVVAIDRRGFGRSTAPPGLARETEDLARVLDAIGVEQATIVGMSQAGRVALDFAARFAGRTRAMVLQGAPLAGVTPGPSEDEAIPIVQYAALVRSGRLGAMKRRWRLHPLMYTPNAEAAAAADAMLADYEGRDLAGESMAAIEESDIERIATRSLVITGALDTPWRRRAADVLAQKLPHAERAEIEDGGHLCNLCAPAAYNAVLRRFLCAHV